MDASDARRAVERMVTVRCCHDRVQAQLARGALQAHGVRAVVLTDDAGGVHPQLGMLLDGAIRVAVADHQADRARGLLDELDAGVHALPSTGDHERIVARRHGVGAAAVAVLLLAVLLVWRAASMVWPGLG